MCLQLVISPNIWSDGSCLVITFSKQMAQVLFSDSLNPNAQSPSSILDSEETKHKIYEQKFLQLVRKLDIIN
jgi:hypothetical protein